MGSFLGIRYLIEMSLYIIGLSMNVKRWVHGVLEFIILCTFYDK